MADRAEAVDVRAAARAEIKIPDGDHSEGIDVIGDEIEKPATLGRFFLRLGARHLRFRHREVLIKHFVRPLLDPGHIIVGKGGRLKVDSRRVRMDLISRRLCPKRIENHLRDHVLRGVHSSQLVPPLGVNLSVYVVSFLRKGSLTVVDVVPHVPVRLLDIGDGRRPTLPLKAAPIGGLAAPLGVEIRAVQHNVFVGRVRDDRVERRDVVIVGEIAEIGHGKRQSRASSRCAQPHFRSSVSFPSARQGGWPLPVFVIYSPSAVFPPGCPSLKPTPSFSDPSVSPGSVGIRTWALSLLLAPFCGYLLWAYAAGTYTVFDTASLIIHEAGHVFFAPFGWTLRALGGSLFQLILPGLFVYSFLYRACMPGTQISLVWWGQNALNVSTYAADAQERALPLITSDPSTHDGWRLLRTADLLAYDDVIGGIFLALALLAFVLALLLPRAPI